MGNYSSKSKKVWTNFGENRNFTILVLGQTGSGKTSFLNLLGSCRSMLTLHLDPSHQVTSEELRRFVDLKISHDSLEHALQDAMTSKTSDAKMYHVPLADNAHFQVIDTPGFGDSRGLDEDKEHVARIMQCLTRVPAVDVVLLTINGRDARLTTHLRYVLTQLSTLMPKVILKQVGVVFTNTERPRQLNFKVDALEEFGIENPHYMCIDNPFGEIRELVLGTPDLKDLKAGDLDWVSTQIRQSWATIECFFWSLHDHQPVQTHHFTELNAQREQIELAFCNIIQTIKALDQKEALLREVQGQIHETGMVQTEVLLKRRHWRLEASLFPWNHYICHHHGCNSNCCESQVFYALAAVFLVLSSKGICTCGHTYSQHRISTSGWSMEESTEIFDLRPFLAGVPPEMRVQKASAVIDEHIQALALEKCSHQDQLTEALVRYDNLGFPHAYLRLLRSQKAVLEEQLSSDPSDQTVKELLKTVNKFLTEIESSAESRCCICFQNPPDTVLNCGHKQFCSPCSLHLGNCPLCRVLVTSRDRIS